MILNFRLPKKNRRFSKSDREAAYKQLPTRPDHANLAMSAIRDPVTPRRMAFHPKALLVGATSAFLRYN